MPAPCWRATSSRWGSGLGLGFGVGFSVRVRVRMAARRRRVLEGYQQQVGTNYCGAQPLPTVYPKPEGFHSGNPQPHLQLMSCPRSRCSCVPRQNLAVTRCDPDHFQHYVAGHAAVAIARSEASNRRLRPTSKSRHIPALVMTLASVQDAHEFYLYTLSGLTRSALSGLVDDDPPAAASGAPQPQQSDSHQQPASALSLSGECSRIPRISRQEDTKPVSPCAYGAVVAGTQWCHATFADLIS